MANGPTFLKAVNLNIINIFFYLLLYSGKTLTLINCNQLTIVVRPFPIFVLALWLTFH